MPAAGALRVLRDAFGTRELRRLQLAWAGTELGHWSFLVVLSVYAYRHGGASAVGLVAFARMAPAAFAAPYTSLLGDRHSRRDVLLATTVLRAGGRLLAAGAIATGAPLGVIVAIAAAHTLAGTAYKPAQAALLPALARTPQQMAAANAVWSGVDNAGFLVGALVGGWAIGALAPQSAFALTALPFGVGALLLARLPRDPTPEHREHLADASVRREILGGFRAVGGEPRLRLVVGLHTAATLIEGAIDVLIVVVALRLLGVGAAGVGWLNSGWGMGGIAGGVAALALLGRGRLTWGLGAGCVLAGVPFALIAAVPHAGVALAMLMLLGVGYALVEVATLTLLQRLAADDVLARAFGVMEGSYYLTTGLGGLLASVLVAGLGVRGAVVAAGACLPLLAALLRRPLARFEAGAAIPERQFALLRGAPLFAPLPIAVVENLARRLTPVRAQDGAVVVAQGEPGDRFYLIAEGAMEVLEDGVLRRREGPGEFFGEIALLRDVPRTATVRAAGPALLYALAREDFLGGVTGHPRSTQAAERVVGARLAAAQAGA